jgi:hypothetical protein
MVPIVAVTISEQFRLVWHLWLQKEFVHKKFYPKFTYTHFINTTQKMEEIWGGLHFRFYNSLHPSGPQAELGYIFHKKYVCRPALLYYEKKRECQLFHGMAKKCGCIISRGLHIMIVIDYKGWIIYINVNHPTFFYFHTKLGMYYQITFLSSWCGYGFTRRHSPGVNRKSTAITHIPSLCVVH